LIGTWIAGTLIALATLILGLARLSWIRSRARRLDDGMWPALARDIARANGIRRPITLLHSDHPSLLFTWGFWRPIVVLPRDASEWSLERAHIVLCHELAHVRRGDWLALLTAGVFVVGRDDGVYRPQAEQAARALHVSLSTFRRDMRAGVAFDEDYLATSGAIIAYRKATNWAPLDPGEAPSDLRSFYRTMTERDGPHGGRFRAAADEHQDAEHNGERPGFSDRSHGAPVPSVSVV
jgi:hypothetical protein